MGRKLLYEKVLARLPIGTGDRIGAVLVDGETLAEFLHEAVESALKRRERPPRR